MTSEQAFKELKTNAEDATRWELDRLKVIEQDLKLLKIFKKYAYYDDVNHCVEMYPIRKSVYNFDYEDVKEWLENEE